MSEKDIRYVLLGKTREYFNSCENLYAFMKNNEIYFSLPLNYTLDLISVDCFIRDINTTDIVMFLTYMINNSFWKKKYLLKVEQRNGLVNILNSKEIDDKMFNEIYFKDALYLDEKYKNKGNEEQE